MTTADEFRAQLLLRRSQLGLTQTDVAKAMQQRGHQFHQQTIQRIESGERPIRLDEAGALAEALAMPYRWQTDIGADDQDAAALILTTKNGTLCRINAAGRDLRRLAGPELAACRALLEVLAGNRPEALVELMATTAKLAGATVRAALARPEAPEPLIDPDCRGGKCSSCVGGPCEHECHTPEDQ